MKRLPVIFYCALIFLGHSSTKAATIVISTDTTVAEGDTTTVDGKDVIVNASATLTLAGIHPLNSLTVAGTVTHQARDTNGIFPSSRVCCTFSLLEESMSVRRGALVGALVT